MTETDPSKAVNEYSARDHSRVMSTLRLAAIATLVMALTIGAVYVWPNP